MFSYGKNSTRLGSISKNCKSVGRQFNARDAIMEFRQTDFPEPVCPAISKCGVLVISRYIGLPFVSTPSAAGNSIPL